MNLTEKILAAHAGLDSVKPGDIVETRVDLVMTNDSSGPLVIGELVKHGIDSVFDPERICIVPDHRTPNKDIKSARICQMLREFALKQGIRHFYEVGRMGIEHALLPEKGLVAPGQLIVGGDSHTCTYGALGAFSTGMGATDIAAAMALGKVWLRVPVTVKCVFQGKLQPFVSGKDLILWLISRHGVDGAQYRALEIYDQTVPGLTMDERFTICNMVVEAGAKNGIFPVDQATLDYLAGRAPGGGDILKSDPDARYERVWHFQVDELPPAVARPYSPANVVSVNDIENVRVDQVIIGSCTNGRIGDLRQAAEILRGRKIAPHVRLIIIPATQQVYRQALREGLLEIFLDAEAAISTPTCGPCSGSHMGVLADGEVCASTTNRNFKGRMGGVQSKLYLVSPYVAAATAVAGYLCHPGEIS